MVNECVFCGEEIDVDYPTACDRCKADIDENGTRPYWWMKPEEEDDFDSDE